MKPRELPRAQLSGTAPTLLAEATVVVLVPLDGGGRASEAMALELAAAVARHARRVALVDLSLEEPILTTHPGNASGEGVVDAFLYGASLQRVAVEQDVPGLHVIGVGTQPTDPEEIWSHPRWRRLARGFATEGALLLLLVPLAGVAQLTVEPDRIVVLAPVGTSGVARRLSALDEVRHRGVPVDVVVDTPPPRVTTPPRPRPPAARPVATRRVRPPRRRRWVAAAAVTAIGAASLAVMLAQRTDGSMSESEASDSPAPPAPVLEEAGSDSLYYSVQVAAFQSMANAVERAREYQQAGWAATVSPVRLGRQGTWYRLMVAAVSAPSAAERALARLWNQGLLERPNGTILRTPHAIRLGSYSDTGAARTAREGLRDGGAAAYIVEASDGTVGLFVGAFETPEQARLADSILAAADLQGTVVPRTGIAR